MPHSNLFRIVLGVSLAATSPLSGPPGVQAQSIRISESVSELEARVRRDSLDAAAHYNVAIGYMSRRRFDQADTALHRAVSIDPQFAIAYFALGLVQDRNDRYWDGLKRAGGDSAVAREVRRRVGYERKAFLIDPFVDVRLLGSIMRRGYLSLGVNSAVEHLAEGNYQRSYDEFERIMRFVVGSYGLDSISPGLLWLHSLAAAHTAHYAEAIADVEALIRQSLAVERDDSTHTTPLRTNEYRYMLAALHQRAGNRAQAINGYREVITNDIGNYMAHVQLARLFEAERNWTQAIAERRAAADVNPEDHTLAFELGATLARTAQWPAAEEALERARQMQPAYVRTWHALGVVQQQMGKRDEARAALNHFLVVAPSRFTAQINDARTRLTQIP